MAVDRYDHLTGVRCGVGLRRSTQPEEDMTEIREPDIITEALAIIDRALSEIGSRSLVSTIEISDVLLDVRSLLTNQA
jgi:hypothetical protein